MGCHWWNRWYHQRLREADVLYLLPCIRLSAESHVDGVVGTEAWTRAVEAKIDAAFELHKALPGQDHWHCHCAGEGML